MGVDPDKIKSNRKIMQAVAESQGKPQISRRTKKSSENLCGQVEATKPQTKAKQMRGKADLAKGVVCISSHEGYLEAFIPMTIPSEANKREHWSARHRRHKNNAVLIKYALAEQIKNNPTLKLPLAITLTRVAPRELDKDNLISSMKNHTDIIADLLIPGLKPGQADSDKRLTFSYAQIKRSKTNALQVEIKAIPKYLHDMIPPDLLD